jgi:toxin CptA
LAAFLLLVHCASLAAVLAVPLDWYWRAGLACLVLGGLAFAIGAHVLYLVPWAVREANWASDGTWHLTMASGDSVEARLLPSTYVTGPLLVLGFRCGGWLARARSLVLLPDSVDADVLRRLRVRLRLDGMAPRRDADDPF